MKSVGEVMAIGRTFGGRPAEGRLRSLETGLTGLQRSCRERAAPDSGREQRPDAIRPPPRRLAPTARAASASPQPRRMSFGRRDLERPCRLSIPGSSNSLARSSPSRSGAAGRRDCLESCPRNCCARLKRSGLPRPADRRELAGPPGTGRRCAALREEPGYRARSTRWSTPAPPSSPRLTRRTCTRATRPARTEDRAESRGGSQRPRQGHDPGRRPEPHRPGDRVRLLLRPRRLRAGRRPATRPSWSTATRRRCRPTTTPRTGSILRAPHRRGRASTSSDTEQANGAAHGRHRAVRRPDAAEAAPALEAARIPIHGHRIRDAIDLAEDPRAFPRLLASDGSAATGERRGDLIEDQAIATAERIGYPVLVRPSPTSWAAGRWRSSYDEAEPADRYMRDRGQLSRSATPGPDRPATCATPSRSTSTRSRTAPKWRGRRRHHGAHRGGRHPFGRFGLFACRPIRSPPR